MLSGPHACCSKFLLKLASHKWFVRARQQVSSREALLKLLNVATVANKGFSTKKSTIKGHRKLILLEFKKLQIELHHHQLFVIKFLRYAKTQK